MDTSKTYIKMCEKALKDIEWTPKVGDYVFRKFTVFGEELDSKIWSKDKMVEIEILHFQSRIDGYWHACNENGEERIFKTPEDLVKATSIPLFRQDQLQEMYRWISGEQKAPVLYDAIVIRSFLWDENDETVPYFRQFTSMEQLWLAFVMKEKYGKTWSKEKEEWT